MKDDAHKTGQAKCHIATSSKLPPGTTGEGEEKHEGSKTTYNHRTYLGGSTGEKDQLD